MSLRILNIEEHETFANTNLLPEFSVCNNRRQSFSLLRLQCKGILKADGDSGPRVTDDHHVQLCENVMKEAVDKNVDLFVTPEYSFPVELIDTMVADKALRPPKNKMWCLSLQAVGHREFGECMDRWESEDVIIIRDSYTDADPYRFVGALIYAFLLNNDKLCLIPQLKTLASADRYLACEGAGLSIGNILYRFGDSNTNRLCAIICSDALNNREIHAARIIQSTTEPVILLHPQLNDEPRNLAFSNLRRSLFGNRESDRLVYITANWAEGTTINVPFEDKPEVIKAPWSCVYFKNDKLDLDRMRDIIVSNHKAGIGYAFWNGIRANIWYAEKRENLQLLMIKKPSQSGMCAGNPAFEVKVEQTWFLLGSELEETYHHQTNLDPRFHFEDDLHQYFSGEDELSESYRYPVEERDLLKRDRFFGLCLGQRDGQLHADSEEICERIALAIDDECDERRRDNKYSFNQLVSALDSGCLPAHITKRANSHQLDLSDDEKYNLRLSDGGNRRWALVAFMQMPKSADGKVDELHQSLGVPKENICIFSYDRGRVVTSPKPNELITNPDFFDEPEITYGGEKYVE